jgi:CMP-N,N'-diacetyllegionaminic acid synthase
MQVLGVVPARGGSKTIPRKNLTAVAGRPLLAWTADAALASVRLARTVLSTDDPEIAEAGRALGLEVPFLRPAVLAGDETPMLAVLQHLVDTLGRDEGYQPDALALLQPTSPLRRARHIDAAIELLERSGADSVVSVVAVPHQFSPVSVLREENGRLVPWGDGPTVTRRQDKPCLYARNGPAVLVTRCSVIAQGSLYGVDSRPLVMSPEESIDIDGPWDLELADWLLRRR